MGGSAWEAWHASVERTVVSQSVSAGVRNKDSELIVLDRILEELNLATCRIVTAAPHLLRLLPILQLIGLDGTAWEVAGPANARFRRPKQDPLSPLTVSDVD